MNANTITALLFSVGICVAAWNFCRGTMLHGVKKRRKIKQQTKDEGKRWLSSTAQFSDVQSLPFYGEILGGRRISQQGVCNQISWTERPDIYDGHFNWPLCVSKGPSSLEKALPAGPAPSITSCENQARQAPDGKKQRNSDRIFAIIKASTYDGQKMNIRHETQKAGLLRECTSSAWPAWSSQGSTVQTRPLPVKTPSVEAANKAMKARIEASRDSYLQNRQSASPEQQGTSSLTHSACAGGTTPWLLGTAMGI